MQLNSRVLCKLQWESFRTTGSLADASYAECSDRSDFMVQNLFAHGQWTRQRTGKVKTTLHGTSWYSGTATQHYTFHGVACMATINYMIHDVRLQIKKYAERISASCIFHSDTVPHALPRFHNPFSSVLVQFEKATVQPRTLCRLSSSWTHQGLQWKCFRKLAQRNGWVLAIRVGVLSLSPGSYILKRMVFITASFGDGRFKAVFWWEICRVTTLWNAAGHDPKGHGYRRHRQDRPLVSSDATAAAEEWCFFVQSSRNQKTDKWRLPLNHVEACSRMLRSTSHADDIRRCLHFYLSKWRFV